MNPCRVAFIGAGYTAREHLRAFKSLPQVEVVGLYSRTRARAEALAAEFGVSLVCDSVEELFNKTRADLVVVTVKELSMSAVAKTCFEFPWMVLTEKPLGYCLADALDIQNAARAKKSRVFVAFNRRMMSSTLAVVDQLATCEGRRFIKVQDQENQAQALAGGHSTEVVQNWMFANSIHIVDYLRVLARGEVRGVRPIVPWNPAAPGVVLTQIEFESGDLGVYEGIWHAPGPWAISATVPGRRWELRPLEQAVTQELGKAAAPLPFDENDKVYKPGYRLQAEVATALAMGQSHPRAALLASVDDSIETMRLIDRIFASRRD